MHWSSKHAGCEVFKCPAYQRKQQISNDLVKIPSGACFKFLARRNFPLNYFFLHKSFKVQGTGNKDFLSYANKVGLMYMYRILCHIRLCCVRSLLRLFYFIARYYAKMHILYVQYTLFKVALLLLHYTAQHTKTHTRTQY
jgi:hypothetical protein